MAAKLQPLSSSLLPLMLLLLFFFFFLSVSSSVLRFSENGEFKILQVADMHYSNGIITRCEDVWNEQWYGCSDLSTIAFLQRMIRAENPDLIVFTGDNIFGSDAFNAVTSMNFAFALAVESKIPWVAILGNHDQQSTLSREGLMKHIVTMEHTLSQVNPVDADNIDGFGNYNLEVKGVEGSRLVNKSILNLYFLDSGDDSKVSAVKGYDWIKLSQQVWFQQTSRKLQESYMKEPNAQKNPAPGLVYFHIPLPESGSINSSDFTGVKQEGIGSPSVNSGFFTTMVETGDVKAVFNGHDHINDFCGKLNDIQLCYAGGFGYHAYGKAGWDRRSRVVLASLEKTESGSWGEVRSIATWKRLDDQDLSTIDFQVLWATPLSGGLNKES